MEPENNTKRWWILAIFIGILVLIVAVVTLKAIRKEGSASLADKLSKSEMNTAAQLKTKSGFRLKVLSGNTVHVGDNIRLGVYANSGKIDVVGFDLSMLYAKSLSYVGSESKLDGFDVIETVEPDGKVIITGAKQLSNKKPAHWADEQIMMLTFKAQRAGIATVGFELSPGSISDTNMFNNQNRDLVTIAIGSTIQIQ